MAKATEQQKEHMREWYKKNKAIHNMHRALEYIPKKMHNCKRVDKLITCFIKEIEDQCEPRCENSIDWEHIKLIKQQLYILKSITERWMVQSNQTMNYKVYIGVKHI